MAKAPQLSGPPRLLGHRHVVRPVPVDPSGEAGPTGKQARGPPFRRTSTGLYVPTSVNGHDPEQRIYEAAVRLPSYGGVTGFAGLRWGGALWFDGMDARGAEAPVVLAVMHGEVRRQPGIVVTSERLPPGDLMTEDGVNLTTHVRSICFEMRYCGSDRRAVLLLDMAMMDDVVSLEEVAAYVATLNGWIGVGRCRFALALGDENCWSAMECEMRLIWVIDLDLPAPLCNQPVFDLEGRHIGTPDLLDVEAGVVGEYEGGLHLEGVRRGRDLQREAAFRRVGLEYVVMVGADRACPEATIMPRIMEARARARWEPESRRAWTVTPPAWWRSTTTVAARRALSELDRVRLLGYRAG